MADNNFFFVFMGSKEEQVAQIDEKIRMLSAILEVQKENGIVDRLNDRINELYKQKEELKQSKG